MVLVLIVAGHIMLAFSVLPFYRSLLANSLSLESMAVLPLILFHGAFLNIQVGYEPLSVLLLAGGWVCLSIAGFMMGILHRWFPFFIERVGLAAAACTLYGWLSIDPLPSNLKLILLLLPIVYVLGRDAWFGGSLLRQLDGKRVVTQHQRPVKLWQSVARNLPLCVPVLPWICFWQLFMGNSSRLGERLSRTWVVPAGKADRCPPPENPETAS